MFLKIKTEFWVLLISGIITVLAVGYVYRLCMFEAISYNSRVEIIGHYFKTSFNGKALVLLDSRHGKEREKETILFRQGKLIFEKSVFPYDSSPSIIDILNLFILLCGLIAGIIFFGDCLYILFVRD
ncbi:MAG: hypothetical protein V1684_00765 [bacterium]